MFRKFGMPFSKRFRMSHFTLLLRLVISSCVKDASSVSITSPSPERESMFSFSKRTLTPSSFRCWTVSRRSIVFLANLDSRRP